MEILADCFDAIFLIHSLLNLSDAKEKRIARRIITRTHLVALTKIIMDAADEGFEIEHLVEWVKVFFNGGSSATVDDDYNAASGAGSARRDKIETRMTAISEHFENYMAELEERSHVGNSVADTTTDADDDESLEV